MKKLHIILPTLLIAVFAVFYYKDREAAALRDTAAAEQRAAAERAEQQKKDADAKRAREDAERRAREREAEQQRKDAEKLAKFQRDLDTLRAERERLDATGADRKKELAALEQKLAALRAQNAAARDTLFNTQKTNESLSISRRNAELELQRLTAILARRAATSAAILPPPPPPPATAK